mmetsp:Transcript_6363/g.16148  ORF Transcript_6363/g.16148 Transcript_6363/m.16148 type:complete len:303 (-) Transcript_6363:172-1080(-)
MRYNQGVVRQPIGVHEKMEESPSPCVEADTMRKRIGQREYDAVAEVLQSQAEQFKQQVSDLHSLSQHQWQYIRRIFFSQQSPMMGNQSYAGMTQVKGAPAFQVNSSTSMDSSATRMGVPSQAGGMLPVGNAQTTNPLALWYGAHGGSAQGIPTQGKSPTEPVAKANWWEDPMQAFGMHTPVLISRSELHGGMASGSQKLESTVMDSNHPSLVKGSDYMMGSLGCRGDASQTCPRVSLGVPRPDHALESNNKRKRIREDHASEPTDHDKQLSTLACPSPQRGTPEATAGIYRQMSLKKKKKSS